MTTLVILLGPLPCAAPLPHPLFHTASQRDGRAGPWVWMDAWCMGAVRHPILPLVLRSAASSGIAAYDAGAGGGGHGQQYDDRGVARAPYMRGHNPQCRIADSAIRHCRLAVHARCALGATLPAHIPCEPSSETFVGGSSPELPLMNTEGLRGMCGRCRV
jgi:hypothetical protein